MPSVAPFKHVPPAGATIGPPLSNTSKRIYFVDDVRTEPSPLTYVYARAYGADRMCPYGDSVALSDIRDTAIATLIKREVSDGVIALDYAPEALDILKQEREGTYNVVQIDANYAPAPIE